MRSGHTDPGIIGTHPEGRPFERISSVLSGQLFDLSAEESALSFGGACADMSHWHSGTHRDRLPCLSGEHTIRTAPRKGLPMIPLTVWMVHAISTNGEGHIESMVSARNPSSQ